MSDKRKYWLQVLLSKPYMTTDEFKKVAISMDKSTEQTVIEWSNYLKSIGLELRAVKSDFTNEYIYGICPIYKDASAKESLPFKAEGVQLFFSILQLIIDATTNFNASIDIGEAIDSAPEGMNQVSAQEEIQKLVDYGYLEKVNERLRLGPRSLLEFKNQFVQIADDSGKDAIHKCSICLDIIIAGKKCSKCDCCIHTSCYQQYEGNTKHFCCPTCGNEEEFIDFGLD